MVNVDKISLSQFKNIAPAQHLDIIKSSPFQNILDRAVESLNSVSNQEIKTGKLLDGYLAGKVGLEEIMIEVEKTSLSVQLSITVVNSGVQAFKELLQMPV